MKMSILIHGDHLSYQITANISPQLSYVIKYYVQVTYGQQRFFSIIGTAQVDQLEEKCAR